MQFHNFKTPNHVQIDQAVAEIYRFAATTTNPALDSRTPPRAALMLAVRGPAAEIRVYALKSTVLGRQMELDGPPLLVSGPGMP